MKIKQLLLGALVAFPLFFSAQIDGHDCGFDDIYERMQKNEPQAYEDFKKNQDELNVFIKNYIAQQKLDGAKKSASTYTIPVVFHVLHDGGPENISYEQILSAIDRLNECFNGLNPELSSIQSVFSPITVNMGVEFKLAKRAPNGACFNGVTRTKSSATFGGNESEQLQAIINGNDVYRGTWRSDEYLNIFVVSKLASEGAAAYAYFPSGTGSSMNNGVWSQHVYIGSTGTSSAGRSGTVVHELGHWFALYHPWGSKNLVNTNPIPEDCDRPDNNDFVDDTPKTIGNKTCNTSANTCDDDDPYWLGRGFPTPMIDNVENFMEYSYCFKMFTIGQGDRMTAALNSTTGGRNNLWQPDNLAATGVNEPDALCKIDFETNKLLVCEGESISFKDLSYSAPSSWTWTFEGADVTTSNDKNPTATYSTAGVYDVTLQVSDGTNTLSTTKTALITVLPNPGLGVSFLENFETSTALPNDRWYITNNLSSDYSITNSAAYTGEKSLKITNSPSRIDNVYELTSPTYDLSGNNSPKVSFKYAFAKRFDTDTDQLDVLISTDCGESWSSRKFLFNLPTAPNTNSTFIPLESDWKEVLIDNMVSGWNVSNFRVKFVFTSGGGNNLYIDDINIFGDVTLDVINKDMGVEAIEYFPNPSNGEEMSLSINLLNPSNVMVNVYDLVGKKAQVLNLGMVQSGKHNLTLKLQDLSSGTYMFETLINGVPAKKDKLVIN
jgi:PKD repeat protein